MEGRPDWQICTVHSEWWILNSRHQIFYTKRKTFDIVQRKVNTTNVRDDWSADSRSVWLITNMLCIWEKSITTPGPESTSSRVELLTFHLISSLVECSRKDETIWRSQLQADWLQPLSILNEIDECFIPAARPWTLHPAS